MDFLDEPTPAEQQAALLQALKARMGIGAPQAPQAADFYRGQGNLALQSGDRVLGGFGQSQIQQAAHLDNQGARGATLLSALARPRGGAPKTQEELDAIEARAEYERAKAVSLRRGPGEADPLKTKILELRGKKLEQELASGGEGSRRQGDDIYKWSGRIPAGTKDGLDSIGRMEAIAARYGGIDKVPGVGVGEGFLPGQALPKDADEFRRTGLAVISKYRNKMFGASLTPGEQAAFKQIADLGGSATGAQVANAIAILKKGFTSGAEEALAGAPEHAKTAIFGDIGIRYGAKPAKGKSGLTPEQRRKEIEELRKQVAE